MPDEEPYWPTIKVPYGVQLHRPNEDEDARMLLGLAAVVREASAADHVLRTLYCALIGSPYAAITAAGQMTGQLVTDCLALIKAKLDLTPQPKESISRLLIELRALSEKRNRFVHDIWAGGPNGPELMRSSLGKKDLTLTPATLKDLIETGQGTLNCHVKITSWILNKPPNSAGMEAHLRWIESEMKDHEDNGNHQPILLQPNFLSQIPLTRSWEPASATPMSARLLSRTSILRPADSTHVRPSRRHGASRGPRGTAPPRERGLLRKGSVQLGSMARGCLLAGREFSGIHACLPGIKQKFRDGHRAVHR